MFLLEVLNIVLSWIQSCVMLFHLLFQMIDHVGGKEEGAYEIYNCVEKIIKQVKYMMHFSFLCLCWFMSLNDVSVIIMWYLGMIQKYLSVLSLISGKQGNVQVENKTPNWAVLLWIETLDHGKGL